MRNRYILTLIIFNLFLSGCQDTFMPSKTEMFESGKGSFSLTINDSGSGRTIMPITVQSDFAAYTLEFFPSGATAETAEPVVTAPRTNANLSAPVLLEAGIWDLYVTAYLDNEAGELNMAAASGILEKINISDGKTVNGLISLKPISYSGKGTFNWNIDYPENVAIAFMTITSFYSDVGVHHYFFGGEPLVGKKDTLSLDSGYYFVDFKLELDNRERKTIRREILHIYQNMESDFQFTFTDRHFPIAPLETILAAWDSDKSQWTLRDADITAAHFIIAGVNGVDDDNFGEIIAWFDDTISVPAVDLPTLKVLVDVALVSIAANKESFRDTSKYTNHSEAETAIHSLVKNGTVIENISWEDYVVATVYLVEQHQVLITFIGNWTFTVTFNSNKGSFVLPLEVPQGDAIFTLPTAIRLGYNFNGWYIDTEQTKKLSFPYTVTQNITLYADWTVRKDDIFVYYANLDDVKLIPRLNDISSSYEILPNSLVIPPGIYNFNGVTYDMHQEGFYLLAHVMSENKQRIVFKDDILALVSGVCWIAYHGNRDDRSSVSERTINATQRKLSLTCTPLAYWANSILWNAGIRSRVVMTLTADEFNDHSNGHTLLEVYNATSGLWTLYDLSLNSYFILHEKPLNLIEFTEAVKNNDPYEVQYIAKDALLDELIISGYNYAIRDALYFYNESLMRSLYKRLANIPLIANGLWYFFDSDNKNRVELYSTAFKYINKIEFMNQFYP